ncbi:hypothetical protein BCR35DRAFT_175555 [Leucosporidium creatinivorum]|uniref:F-box domain-containing protein n=1 Tax=Leucosporidium creatinivorum TaxID=106004 RepID=A0A1Y2G0I5_9BASI|nr:hypothetical protein BCR35DRAFT_175555 [Leucosporidium creatinivorum]
MAPALPAEIIRRILELTENSRQALCHAALVARSWRSEAQAVLWSRVRLDRADTARLFIDSPATQRWLSQGVRKVHVLAIIASKAQKKYINPKLAGQILDVCRGLTTLTLFSIKGQNGSLLYHPSLYNLKKVYSHLDPGTPRSSPKSPRLGRTPRTSPFYRLITSPRESRSFVLSSSVRRRP